ncbi:hypothetical protein [Asticcacaulis sp. AND118]|uniref:hypothetical protein n=1 Tax=Asticcacaulis sp. AND118 TaxID=2840468 RepID=UPI001CFF5F98|nr:hypothetical protein [Asticcacaulis sp. AND118]UDF02509.1 hypothetical protein LH365_08665 [Asticcacaulis sp. AND118]
MKDEDLYNLFQTPMRFDDEPAFQAQVIRRLGAKNWLRQGFIALAGILGGLYALMQFVRVPGLSPATATPARAASSDATFEAGLGFGRELADVTARWVALALSKSTDYLAFAQSPLFFWVSFSLCMSIVGLYLINMREEGI